MHKVDVEATSERIKQLMKQKNITVKDMADRTGVSIFAVYRWLNGSNLPTYETAEDIVKLFGLEKIEDLIVFVNLD